MQNLSELLKKNNQDIAKDLVEKHKFISTEYQDYGYRIALKLDDLSRKALYIKLAKEKPRALIEQAYSFAIDYPKAQNKGKIFMWKLKELVTEYNKGRDINEKPAKNSEKVILSKIIQKKSESTKKEINNSDNKRNNKIEKDSTQLTLL